ncbi:hypothetical protein HAV22_00345 [Massilia sp. TW-1]|uniref:Uncharacterized protein n=1 Tax=Telluria antibiotica TaxID=2717319 RepID=A0ABX0P4H4_9BURK|nr:hypothetical protein [Telluria antibiotica]NIA52100.1 hypothetical protein [Telluria antibiotica]
MLKTYQVALVLSLLVPLAHAVDAKPSSSGFKSGFSSQRSSSAPHTSSTPAKSGGFGSFGKRAAPSDATAPAAKPSGGFGSFGGGQAAPQKSDSALSQKLNKNASEANALRTLDARRQAQADSARDTRPVPGYEQGASSQPAPTYAPPPQQQAPVVVRQDSGLGHVLAGAMIANAARGAHASNNGYPGAYPSSGGGGVTAPARGGGTSFIGLFFTLCVLVAIAWGVYFMWRRVQRARAANAKKQNYSFERN